MATLATVLTILSVLNAVGTGALNADKIKAVVMRVIAEHTAADGTDPDVPLSAEHAAQIESAVPGSTTGKLP